jgi:hypothetical protein
VRNEFVIALEMNCRESDRNLFSLGGVLENVSSLSLAATDKFHVSVADHLGRVDAVDVESLCLSNLTITVVPEGIRVLPSDIIPVVDVFAEDDQVRLGHRLGPIQLSKKGIGGRATRAAFRSEKFDQHQCPRGADARLSVGASSPPAPEQHKDKDRKQSNYCNPGAHPYGHR